MTPAEFKTLRESLGLTAQWIADQSGVKLRTVQYWETGRMAVPKDVVQLLNEIELLLESTVTQVLAQVDEMNNQKGPPHEITLVRYRTDADLWQFYPNMKPLPTSTHASMLSRIRRSLWRRQISSVIEYMNPDDYLIWLAGRTDTQEHRAAWAASLRD